MQNSNYLDAKDTMSYSMEDFSIVEQDSILEYTEPPSFDLDAYQTGRFADDTLGFISGRNCDSVDDQDDNAFADDCHPDKGNCHENEPEHDVFIDEEQSGDPPKVRSVARNKKKAPRKNSTRKKKARKQELVSMEEDYDQYDDDFLIRFFLRLVGCFVIVSIIAFLVGFSLAKHHKNSLRPQAAPKAPSILQTTAPTKLSIAPPTAQPVAALPLSWASQNLSQNRFPAVPCDQDSTCTNIMMAIQPGMPSSLLQFMQTEGTCQYYALTRLRQAQNVSNFSLFRIRQRYALTVLYCQLQGDQWPTGANWTSNTLSECDWPSPAKGHAPYSACNSKQEFQILRLIDQAPQPPATLNNLFSWSLNYTLPMELAMITSLKELTLSGNFIRGSIPTEYRVLTNLTVLDLSSNALVGSIPTVMGKLTDLRSVNLRGNQLTGTMPTEICLLRQLSLLNLSVGCPGGSPRVVCSIPECCTAC